MKRIFFAFNLLLFLSITNLPAISQSIPCEPNRVGLSDTTIKLTDADMPPLSPSMPYDVLVGYHVADSVFKQFDRKQITEFMKWQTDNDTMNYIKKYIYLMEDYNPIDFYLYLKFEKSTYKVFTDDVEALFGRQLIKTSKEPFIDNLLTSAFFIAHVRVVDTIRRVQKTDVGSIEIAIVTCQIIDTIKGKVMPECHDLTLGGNIVTYDKNNKLSSLQPALPGSCIQFQYTLEWMRGNSLGFTPQDTLGEQWTKKNMEYIIFLRPVIICWDSLYSYYEFWPYNTGSMSYSMYPIVNGIVQEPENYFGFGKDLTVDEFKAALRKKISDIVNFKK